MDKLSNGATIICRNRVEVNYYVVLAMWKKANNIEYIVWNEYQDENGKYSYSSGDYALNLFHAVDAYKKRLNIN